MDNSGVKIGVVVAVYNTEKWLRECLESLVNQTKRFFEIVLVDDGSTDDSFAICEEFRDRYSEIKVYHQENGKQGKARNNGIAHISSDYVLFVDSDDVLEENAVEQLSGIICKKKYDAIYFEARVFGQAGLIEFCNYNRESKAQMIEGTGRHFFHQCYPRSFFPSACLAVYRTDLIRSEGIYFPENVFYEDNYFTFAYMQAARLVYCIPDILYGRRVRIGSTMTSEITAEKVLDFCEVVLSIYRYISLHKGDTKDGTNTVEQYVCDLCFSVLTKYDIYNEHAKEGDCCNTDKLKCVLKAYFKLSKELNFDYEQWSLSCIVTEQRILLLVEKIWDRHFLNDIETTDRKEKSHRCMHRKYRELLGKLPLDRANAKVGIYGIGRHTKGLLSVYHTLIGTVQAQLVFFETNVTKSKWEGYQVKNYSEADDTYDFIIISSYLYQPDMKNNMLSVNKGCSLVCFYDEVIRRDIFSEADKFVYKIHGLEGRDKK